MNQMLSYGAIAIILISHCIDGHEQSANVNRMKRLTDNASMQLQQPNPSNLANSDQRNILKDRINSDKIIFDRGDLFETVKTEKPSATSMAQTISNNMFKSNETNHQYTGKPNGEYEFSLTIRNGIRRVESGEFEEHNKHKVFVVRGFFEHITKEGILKVTAYAFDHTGYHEIPVKTDSDGVIDLYGPEQAHDCDFSKGVYCIDRKLLSLMVG